MSKTNEMYKLYKTGLSLSDVGSVFGVTRQSVYSRFKRHRLATRPLKKKPFIIVGSHKYTINRDGYYESTTVGRKMLHNDVYGVVPVGHEIHHIDGNKTNNNLDNLKALTPSEHTKLHAKERNGSGMNKKVKCIETGFVFDSIIQVANKHNQHASNVSRYYIDGKRKLNGYTYVKI